MRRFSGLLSIAPFLAAVAYGSPSATPSAPIHDCASFRTWFNTQPASLLTLETAGTRAAPEPTSKASLRPDMTNATWWKGHVGGGGCLSGWYDPVHHVVALEDDADTYQHVLIFTPTSIPVGVRTRDLSMISLDNGLRLGTSRAQVEAIEGRGRVTHLPDGETIRYHWSANHVDHNLSFGFEHDRLIAIDSGFGV